MSELLALEWNSHEIRVAVACGRGNRVVIEHAFLVPWNEGASGAGQPEQRIGQRIAEELDLRGIGRPQTLVAVGRTSIELRQIQLPPAPDEDLPDMVHFQAAREFNELDEHWLLDFVPIDEGSDGPRTVLATAIAPVVIGQIEGVCQGAGLKMQRLLLRPCAAASLLTGEKAETRGKLRLLVDLLSDEADLTVVLDGKAVFLRTMRLAANLPPLPALLAEIRLTMAAVQSQLAGRKVQAIVLCGQDKIHADLAQSIEAEFGLPTESIDPFAGLELGPALRGSLPEHPGRFAPLLGMLLAEIKQTSHAIDFLHPRRRAEPPSRRKTWIAAAVVAALLPLGYLTYARIESYLLANEVDRLTTQSKSLDADIVSAKKVRTTVAEISKWTDGEAIWLDQLRALSEGFPPAQEAILGQLTFAARQGGSQVDLKGWVRNAEVIATMEERVRARAGQIAGKSSREDNSMKNYSWRFEASLLQAKGPKP